ncbi:hypothetical protein [Bartonella sp. LJL80]
MIKIERVEALFSAVKELRDETRKYVKASQKLAEKDHHAQRSYAAAKLTEHARALSALEDKAHALAVDCGLSPLRDLQCYEPRVVNNNGWHDHLYHPPRPERLPPLENKSHVHLMGMNKEHRRAS